MCPGVCACDAVHPTLYVDEDVRSGESLKHLERNNILILKVFSPSSARLMNQRIDPLDIWKFKQGMDVLLQN